MPNKRIRIFAGPNGSGKSSLFEEFSKNYATGFFVNADKIEIKLTTKGLIDLQELDLKVTQKDLDLFAKRPSSVSLIEKALKENHPINVQISENCVVDKSKESHSYEASYVASFIRHMLIEQSKSFSFETVMSHPSKISEIQELKESGYLPYLYFVCIDDPDVNVARVANRVDKGGHAVDELKIVQRYVRTLGLLHEMLPLCHRAYLFDNSGKKQVMIAELYKGALKLLTDTPPQWFMNYVLPYYS
ncbi:zeta toxin family protein [Flavobacterium agrisoli]|uniref:Zeta toxin family protein n=1 Tax=Flavobacterium agrisoli TaxID=2793066 RepID=A0A934PQ82_9FLAO|nr:zeta toxin family protein [Flavobacterium agrisoli]MBK0370909.1 zeta toxin family protein [Flavobacterium agrisoli]